MAVCPESLSMRPTTNQYQYLEPVPKRLFGIGLSERPTLDNPAPGAVNMTECGKSYFRG